MKSYGISEIEDTNDEVALIRESLRISGFAIMQGVLNAEQIEKYNVLSEEVYKQQVEEVGEDFITKIGEQDMARCPMAYNADFYDLVFNEQVQNVAKAVLGDYFILSLQNTIINRPQIKHHQTSWHRDLPYQEFTTSAPLGLNAFYCLCDFNAETGGTLVMPGSHMHNHFPTQTYVDKHELQVEAPAGSVVFFDPMLYHRAGSNTSNIVRRGVNHLFTRAFIKQQIDLTRFLDGKVDNLTDYQKQVLGFGCAVPGSVTEWRRSRLKK